MDKEKVERINDLIVGLKHGDEECIYELHSIMSPTIRYIALKYLRNENDAQDMVQDFWADINRICTLFIFSKNGFNFLCKAMTRRTINRYHKLKREKTITVHYVDYSAITHYDDCSSEDIGVRAEISAALEKLSETERIIIQESFFEDKTIREIAKDLNISKTKVGELKLKAINFLKKELS